MNEDIYLVSPWMEFGDLSKFVSTRLQYLDLKPEDRASHKNRYAFETFNEASIVSAQVWSQNKLL